MKAERPRVLYLSYDGLTDPLGQSQILPYLAGLRGYDISIISFEKPARYHRDGASMAQFCSQKGLDWHPMTYHKHPPVFSTLFDLWNLRRRVLDLHAMHNFKIVHCRSYITSLVGLMMKRKFGSRFIFDMRGFWADERVEGGLWNLSSPVYRQIYNYFKRREKEFFKEADVVVSLTESAKEFIRSNSLADQVSVIPCCVDAELFDPATISLERTSLIRRELKIDNKAFVLLYLGSLGTWYLFDEMVALFRAIKARRPDAKFLIVSPDRRSVEPDISSDTVVVTVARNDVPSYIKTCDASVLFIKPTFSKSASSATKLAEVLAMGVPVITNKGWGDVERYKVTGLMVSDLQDLDASARLILATRPLLEIRQRAIEEFSLDRGIAEYQRIYAKLA